MDWWDCQLIIKGRTKMNDTFIIPENIGNNRSKKIELSNCELKKTKLHLKVLFFFALKQYIKSNFFSLN